MPPDLALLSTLIGSNYPCLELIFMVPKVFKPLKFDCIINLHEFLVPFLDDVALKMGSTHKDIRSETLDFPSLVTNS